MLPHFTHFFINYLYFFSFILFLFSLQYSFLLIECCFLHSIVFHLYVLQGKEQVAL